jgi:hypothetical protein
MDDDELTGIIHGHRQIAIKYANEMAKNGGAP